MSERSREQLVAVFTLAFLVSCGTGIASDAGTLPLNSSLNPSGKASAATLRMADWLLGNQDSGGALQDYRDGSECNIDSNMEYALIGLAAAYSASGDARYLSGLENGLRWLAARQDMSATKWRGSWFYVYSCDPPYAPISTSPGSGVTDVRGVDSTNALFAYLLYVHRALSRSDALAAELSVNAKAALDFVMTQNMDSDGFTFSSWQLVHGRWQLWTYKYTADQGDVYLGLRAGGLLFDDADRRYGAAADRIAQNLPAKFFDAAADRWAEGLDEDGDIDSSEEFDDSSEGFDVAFPQGYIPWIFGSNPQNLASYQWLLDRVQSDGSVVLYRDDPGYSLSADLLGMAASALSQPRPKASLNWILSETFDAKSGAVRDTRVSDSDEISNVVGFTIVALLGQGPFAW